MAVGITTTDGKDLDDRYLKVDGTNGKAPNAVNAEYATNAGTASSANALNNVLPENKLPTYGEKTLNDGAYRYSYSGTGASDVIGEAATSNIIATENCGGGCSNGSTIYNYTKVALKQNTYGRVTSLGRIKKAMNCNCQCQD